MSGRCCISKIHLVLQDCTPPDKQCPRHDCPLPDQYKQQHIAFKNLDIMNTMLPHPVAVRAVPLCPCNPQTSFLVPKAWLMTGPTSYKYCTCTTHAVVVAVLQLFFLAQPTLCLGLYHPTTSVESLSSTSNIAATPCSRSASTYGPQSASRQICDVLDTNWLATLAAML